MPTVYLIRHGQASFGAADYDELSTMGERQSRVLGEELRRRAVRVDRAVAGTLRRHRDTAVATGLELRLTEDSRWNEYDHLELVQRSLDEPLSSQDFQRVLEKALLEWMTSNPSTWPTFRDSAFDALSELSAGLGRGGTALVFTSGGVISAICSHLLGLPPEGYLALNRTMVNAGLTKLVSGRSGLSLISLNEHGHFEGPNRELLSYR
jgi:broad specificity phosphatase PhoE